MSTNSYTMKGAGDVKVRFSYSNIVAGAIPAARRLCATVAPAAPAEEGAEPVAEAGDKILFWSTEDQPERVERTNAILDAFTEQSGIEVELVPVTEDQLPELLTASAAANTLPDALFFPLDFSIGWAEQGILDYEVAAEDRRRTGLRHLQPGRAGYGHL